MSSGVLIVTNDGIHTLGGSNPSLSVPSIPESPVIYFGCLKNSDPALNWLPFDLSLICPFFLNLYNPIFLDYTNPLIPTIIRHNVETDFENHFPDIPGGTHVEFSPVQFTLDSAKNPETYFDGGLGQFGEIGWTQDDAQPICPRSGAKMKFVAQFGYEESCKVVSGMEQLEKEFFEDHFNMGDGFLYVFMNPDSKVVAYINQVT